VRDGQERRGQVDAAEDGRRRARSRRRHGVRLGAILKVGYFAQQSFDVLDPNLTVWEQIQKDFRSRRSACCAISSARFQFSGDDVEKKIRSLSGGERSRLVLARMLLNPPNFLVLDEPTNHLDLGTKEMLVDALKDFDGTMLFVVARPHVSARTVEARVGAPAEENPTARVRRLVCRVRGEHGARSAGRAR
jgi:ATPase subunit of ABC transporter with duplicated ATPase domains